MTVEESAVSIGRLDVVKAQGEEPVFKAGDAVTISVRFPIGHFRVPNYIRGKHGWIESVIEPPGMNNEEEGYGRNAGNKRHDPDRGRERLATAPQDPTQSRDAADCRAAFSPRNATGRWI